MRTAINLIPEPNSRISANIVDAAGESHKADITLRTMADGSLIMDLAIDDTPLFYGRRCVDKMPLVLSSPVSGNFYFYDLYGNNDPEYSAFNSRYQLIYDTDFNLQ